MSDLPERIWLDQSFQPYRVWTIEMSDLPEYVRTLPAAEPAEDVRAGALKEAAAAVDPAIFDHPSVFMGGPSRQAQKTAEAVRAAILALIPEAKP